VGLRLIFPLTLILAGCGSSWTIRVGEELPVGCTLFNFFPDEDEDGWGDGSVDPVQACEADKEAGLTAKNGRDCDDVDNHISGLVGTLCPSDLKSDNGDALSTYAGVIYDDSEFVIVYGDDSATDTNVQSDKLCEAWAGRVDDIPMGQLATFGSPAELEAVKSRILEAVGVDPFAGLIGLAWDGSSNADGSWQWVDDTADDALIEQELNWCGGVAPAPLDAYPHLVPGNPDHATAINEQLGLVRLALVLDDGGSWCLGFPSDAVSPTDPLAEAYTTTNGHFICQRAKRDAADFRDLVTE